MNVLLHMCCAPCSVYPLERLRESGAAVTGFFYNPNIHPEAEYRRRLAAVQELAARTELTIIYRGRYDLEDFVRTVRGAVGRRCEQCYRMRLEVAAAAARAAGSDRFTTTLLYSKYQDHDLIKGVARESASDQGVEFYYEDFRDGWSRGIAVSKAMGLYRQKYCGCIYSEAEKRLRTAERQKEHAIRQQGKPGTIYGG